VEEVLDQVQLMEQTYESDAEVLEAVASTARLPLERVVEVLGAKVRTICNVGFNATSPERRMAKIMLAIEAFAKFAPNMLNGLDPLELAKEIFGAVGFRDASRFFPNLAGEEDPRIAQMQQQIQELQQIIETKQVEQQGKVEVARVTGEYRLAATQMQTGVAAQLGQLKFEIDAAKLKLEEIDRHLAMEKADKERRELFLEREALSHSIQTANREFQLKLLEFARGPEQKPGGKPGTGGGSKGAYNLPGNDRAGVISRGRYGAVPQHEG
jgi:hypothetical protein